MPLKKKGETGILRSKTKINGTLAVKVFISLKQKENFSFCGVGTAGRILTKRKVA